MEFSLRALVAGRRSGARLRVALRQAQDAPFDSAQDARFDSAQDARFDSAQEARFDSAQPARDGSAQGVSRASGAVFAKSISRAALPKRLFDRPSDSLYSMAIQVGRPATLVPWAPSPTWRVAIAIAAFFIICLVIRFPLRTEYLVNWDSVQFAFATEHFDLHHHRPHPPGYIGYVFAGEALNQLTGDANTSFVILSLAASALAPVLFLMLAVRVLPRMRAYVASALFATSPLLWYYGGVALTYSVEAAMAVGFGLMAWLARHHGGLWLAGASLLLGLTGAVRPTGEALLLPLWVWMVWPAAPSARLYAAATLTATSLLWIVPLVWLTGGTGDYFRESFALAQSAGDSTSLVGGNIVGMAGNWAFLVVSLVALMGAAALPMIWSSRSLSRVTRALPGREQTFLLAWVAPAMLAFLLGHIGQAGYVLILAAPFYLLVGRLEAPPWLKTQSAAYLAVGALVMLNAFVVLRLPEAIYRSLPQQTAFAAQMRQFSPAENDAYWGSVVEFIQRFNPDTTVVLASSGGPNSGGSFRQLSYYLPDYYIYATLQDEVEGFGVFYRAYEHRDDYQISDRWPSQVLQLAPNVKTVIVIDWGVIEDFYFSFPLTEYRLPVGPSVWLGNVEPGTALVFREPRSKMMAAAIGRVIVDAIPPPRAYRLHSDGVTSTP
jgi:hypothetical protein